MFYNTKMKNMMESSISYPIIEMAYPSNFNLKEFSNIRSFKERKKYCDERLQKLGTGSSRIAYRVDDNKVLKIAYNNKGIAQNQHEADWHRNTYGVFAEIFEADTEKYLWLEMEIASKANKNDFQRIFGISWEMTQDMVKYCFEQSSNYNRKKKLYYSTNVEKNYEQMVVKDTSQFFVNFQRYLWDYQVYSVSDWLDIRNWGVVNRNGNDELVIIDDGLDENVWNQYYRR